MRNNAQIHPAFEHGNIPVVFAADNNYAPYLSVAIQSIIENSSNSNNYDVIIITDDISAYYMDLIKYQANGKDNFSIRFFDAKYILDEYRVEQWWRDTRFSPSVYYRLFTPTLFGNFAKIIYLDSDLVVLNDLALLFNIDLKNNLLAAVIDYNLVQFADENIKTYLKEVLNIHDIKEYFNSGVLLLNVQQMIIENTQSDFIRIAQINNRYWHDQNVMNSVCAGRVTFLDSVWNVLAISYVRPINSYLPLSYNDENASARQPSILHFANVDKPWMVSNREFAVFFWKYARKTPFYEIIIYNSEIKRQAEIINDSRQRLHHLEQKTSSARDSTQEQILQLQTELAALASKQELISQLQAELGVVYNSRSWRITKPLRVAIRLLRKDPATISKVKAIIKSRIYQVMRPTVHFVFKRPKLANLAKKMLSYTPALNRRLRGMVLSMNSKYSSVSFNDELSPYARHVYNQLLNAYRLNHKKTELCES